MDLEIDIDGWPSNHDWPDLAERAAEAVEQVAPELANQRLSASALYTVADEIRTLNREWRMKDKPTNVLSFPMMTREELLGLSSDGGPEMLGDIALAWETCLRESQEKGLSLDDHTAHLLVHGLLHLAGHDHEKSEGDADAMEALEIKALAILGIRNPYGVRNNTE